MMKYYSILLVLLVMIFTGCASTAPLPTSINLFEVSPDVSPQLVNYLGVWEGIWNGSLDTILVVTRIDNNKADVIFSLGDDGGYTLVPQNNYINITAEINKGAIEWTQPNERRFVFEMDKASGKIHAYFINIKTGSKKLAFLKKVETNKISKSKINYYRYPPTRAIFTNELNKDKEPIDSVDNINLTTKRIYFYVQWFNLVPGRHEYKCEIYDGSGNLVHSDNMIMEPVGSTYNTWSWYDIKTVDQAGKWDFKVYFDNKIAVNRQLDVSAE